MKKCVKGTLNSKNPNPYEIAYKELWDKLPRWKKVAFSEDIANGKYDWSLYGEFVMQVSELAETMFAEFDETIDLAKQLVEKN